MKYFMNKRLWNYFFTSKYTAIMISTFSISLRKQFSRLRFINLQRFSSTINNGENIYEDPDEVDQEYEQLVKRCFDSKVHKCFIIHPYVKWGPKKDTGTSPEYQISEAIALIDTLSNWKVHDNISVPLETLDKKQLFGSGKLESLKRQIRSDPNITAIFINMGRLKSAQLSELQLQFKVPIFDRYAIVMQILKQHAVSTHAKLQVSLAEIPYLRARLREICTENGLFLDTQKKILFEKELKLKSQIKKLRLHRELLRNRRRQMDYPVVAVVGYTNAGKTSLIKALTGEDLQPRNQLFATLDVTVHKGLSPSRLEVLYVDTVGFISNIPTNLIECFVATLEDAILADVILHVQDLSNENVEYQSKHVDDTLRMLSDKIGALATGRLIDRVLTVGNKIDRVSGEFRVKSNVVVSANKLTGIDVLRQLIETMVIKATGKKTLTIRIPTGGDEIRWLYKNAVIVKEEVDLQDVQFQNVTIIISDAKIQQFHKQFIGR